MFQWDKFSQLRSFPKIVLTTFILSLKLLSNSKCEFKVKVSYDGLYNNIYPLFGWRMQCLNNFPFIFNKFIIAFLECQHRDKGRNNIQRRKLYKKSIFIHILNKTCNFQIATRYLYLITFRSWCLILIQRYLSMKI